MSLLSLMEKFGKPDFKKEGWFEMQEPSLRIPQELLPYLDMEEGKLVEKAPVPEELQGMAESFRESWRKAHAPEDLTEYRSRSEELAEERFTSWADNGKTCGSCIFACGNTPFDNSPDKASCLIYIYPKTKPDSVYLEGKPCKYKRTAEEAVEYAKSSRADNL